MNRNPTMTNRTKKATRRKATLALGCILAVSGQADAFGRTTTATTTTRIAPTSHAPAHPPVTNSRRNSERASLASTRLASSARGGASTNASRSSQQYQDRRLNASTSTTTTGSSSFTALNYRDGDEEQSVSRRVRIQSNEKKQEALAAQDLSSLSSRSSPSGITAQPVTSTSTSTGTKSSNSLWDSLIWRRRKQSPAGRRAAAGGDSGSRSKSAASQLEVDAYLEFIDKRYKRMHDRDHIASAKKTYSAGSASSNTNKDASDNGINTAWNWLMQGSGGSSDGDCNCDAACQQQRQQDALEVLGLAELASAELLRKHHLPVPQEHYEQDDASNGSTSAVVIDVEPITSTGAAAGATSIASVAPAAPGKVVASLTTVVTELRRQHYRTLTVAALSARAAFYNSIKTGASSLRRVATNFWPTLFTATGGRKTLKIASAAAVAAFFMVIKPLSLLVAQSS